MAAEHFLTLGNSQQIAAALRGDHLKGRADRRVAFVGRSNVGKSSLINALTESKVAQVSSEPGKTRLLHFYSWPDAGVILTDLPGYGYARASHSDREDWSRLIESYLKADGALDYAAVLLDARHGPTANDVDAIRFLFRLKIGVLPVFSKFDELKTQSERARRKKEAEAALRDLGCAGGSSFWVSSHSRHGLKELRAWIAGEHHAQKRAAPLLEVPGSRGVGDDE